MIWDDQIDQRRHVLHVIDALNYGGAQELVVGRETLVAGLPPSVHQAKNTSFGSRIHQFLETRQAIHFDLFQTGQSALAPWIRIGNR